VDSGLFSRICGGDELPGDPMFAESQAKILEMMLA
jgi:hypothetical protein